MTADSTDETLDDVVADGETSDGAEEDSRHEMEVLLESSGDVWEKGYVTLSNGHQLELKQLKARQLFSLMRIITRGAFELMPSLMSNMGQQTADEFANSLIAVAVWAVPEAPEATLDFLRSMLVFDMGPDNKVSERGMEDIELLMDPEMEDILEIVSAIIVNNSDDLVSLGKKMRGALEVMKKTGQLKDQGSETSSVLSPESST